MASNLAPPPPPVGGPPPPPLPGGGPPPPPPPGGLQLPPPPGLPPPVSAAPSLLPPQQSLPPSRNPFTPTLLLTNVPPFLHTFRSVRDWLYPCGSVRNCIFYPRQVHDDYGDPQELPSDARISIIVTMSHPDGACKLLGAFKQFASRLDDRYNTLQAYMVPANKDIPLPPPLLDEESQQVLGEKLWQNFVTAEAPELHGGAGSGPSNAAAASNEASSSSNNNDDTNKPLDADKVAAAAGGNNYDADEDPLNAPAVLEAVKEFRRKLTKTQSYQKRKRMELVAQKVAQMKPRVLAMVEEEKNRPPPVPVPAVAVPPPLPPGGLSLPPPPLAPGAASAAAIPAAGAAAGDSGKRGRSNLPAWMTNQAAAEAATTAPSGEGNGDDADGPASKRAKTDDEPNHPANFPPLPPSTHAPLKEFVAQKVQEALGEEEAELIQFVHSHVVGGKATAELLQELQMVLEEEAGPFLQAVWQKVGELQQQQS